MLSFRDSGGAGEAALLLHGAYLCAGAWEAQVQALGPHFRLIVPDLPLHGGSAEVMALSAEAMAQACLALITELGLEKVHLVGHSLGGMVAQALASAAPERVRSLTLIESSYGIGAHPLSASVTAALHSVPVRWQLRAFAWALAPTSALQRQALLGWMCPFAADPRRYRAVWRVVSRFDGLARLRELRMPTLILAARNNPQTHSQAREMARRIPGARLHFLTGGHLLPQHSPSEVNAALLQFWLEHHGQGRL